MSVINRYAPEIIPGGVCAPFYPEMDVDAVFEPQLDAVVKAYEAPALSTESNSVRVAKEMQTYDELRYAASLVEHTETQDTALQNTKVIVGEWLHERESQFATASVKDFAANRITELSRLLQKRYLSTGFNPVGVNGFELDTSTQLVDAAVAYETLSREERKAVQLPELGSALEAMPILRYVPESQRKALLVGLPAMLTELLPYQTAKEQTVFGKLKAHVAEALRPLRRQRRLGGTAVAAAAPEAKPTAQSAPDREIIASNGKRLRLVSYYDTGDAAYETLTAKVVEGRSREYQRHNLLEPDAKLDEIRGPHVEILAAIDPETNEPVASLRKIHTTGTAMNVLPSYKKFESDGAWSAEGKALLEERTAGDRPVVEIAALWKEDQYETDIKIELYVAAIQASVDRGELWFMGIVQGEYASLLRTYGKHVTRTLGDAVMVKGEGAKDKVRLRPVMVDPGTFHDDMMDEIDEAREKGDRQLAAARAMTLGVFLISQDWTRLGPTTRKRLEDLVQ